ncbi:MAG: F0F1 ATP synthase subunit delta [Proteobacteria bacterium]|nr:F0F1 ATP synthase subunit delta [Pseudomonadota bacterium]
MPDARTGLVGCIVRAPRGSKRFGNTSLVASASTSSGGQTASAAASGTTVASGGGLADRYATALYSYADDSHALDAVVAEMEQLGQMIDSSADLRRLIFSPLIDVQQATRAAFAVLEQAGFGKPVRDFVGVIAANRRLSSLRTIIGAFAALVAAKRGIVTAHVESAHPLSDVQRTQLRARLIEAGYGNVNIVEQVQPDLLGGLVVRIGARLYDTSLKSRLQRLQYAMKGAA